MKHYQHILCLTDFSPASAKGLERAGWLSEITDARLTLAHFVAPFIIPEYALGTIETSNNALEEAKAQAQKTLQVHRLMNATLHVEEKNTRLGITEFLAQSDVDLIIMGRHGTHSLAEKLVGSTSHYVINHAACDVIVVQESIVTASINEIKPASVAQAGF